MICIVCQVFTYNNGWKDRCPYCGWEEEEFVQTGNGTVAQRLQELEEEE